MFFRRKTDKRPVKKPIYGVNLGGWLVLEKWITPSLFKDTAALDEYTLYEKADDALLARIKHHHDSFVTKSDLAWLRENGVDAVRLPLGYGVFGDEAPFTSTIEYVDKVFEWAYQEGLMVLLDLHTAPGSQNGWQESGRIGKVGWHKDEKNILKSLRVIEKLAQRYGNREVLLGIELLNEPHSKIPRRKLLRYYDAAYKLIRRECGTKVWVVFSDNFKPGRWKRKLRVPQYENMFIDTHVYQTYTKRDQKLGIRGHLKKMLGKVTKKLRKMQKYHPVIVGEWSLALNHKSLEGFNEMQMTAARSAYGAAQLITYERTAAWFYWTYKAEGGGPWNFRGAVEKGWILPLTRKI